MFDCLHLAAHPVVSRFKLRARVRAENTGADTARPVINFHMPEHKMNAALSSVEGRVDQIFCGGQTGTRRSGAAFTAGPKPNNSQ
jgi:hypothetical protein